MQTELAAPAALELDTAGTGLTPSQVVRALALMPVIPRPARAQYSPGPWEWVDEYTLIVAAVARDSSRFALHTVVGTNGAQMMWGPQEERRWDDADREAAANRQLIKNAPRLAGALHRLTSADVLTAEDWAEARAALAEAIEVPA